MRIILMRVLALALCTSMLAACSGAGPQTIGNVPAPASPTTTATTAHTFVNPTEQKVYNAVGGTHSYSYSTRQDLISGAKSGQYSQLYQGNASTVRNSGITVDYNPRDAIFDIKINDQFSGITSVNDRFQDPAHRTDFGGAREPQTGIPNLTLPGIQYLQSGVSTATLSLEPGTLLANLQPGNTSGTYNGTSYFYQKPGTTTKYVTFAGYLRNNISVNRVRTAAILAAPATPTTPEVIGQPAKDIVTRDYTLYRGAFVFGENTGIGAVPKTGTGSYTGSMLATMVFNDQIDNFGLDSPTYFQWIEGTSTTKVDFLASTFTLGLNGTVFAPQIDGTTGNVSTLLSGATFTANGSGRIDLAGAGGFLGQFQQAWFVNPNSARFDVNIGGSSINGAFYGPAAQEVGGGYRIVGGTPDERVDILGVFVGK
jgi:C-lobe and N-lobe beta barrels of Tf-binding protein B